MEISVAFIKEAISRVRMRMALHNYLERRREEERVRKKAELAKQAEPAKWTGIGEWAARQKWAGMLSPTRQFLKTMEKRMPGLLARFEKGYNVEKAIQNPDSPLMRHVMSQNWPGQLTHQQLTDLGRSRPITNNMFTQGEPFWKELVTLRRPVFLAEAAGLPIPQQGYLTRAALEDLSPEAIQYQSLIKEILRAGQQYSRTHNVPFDVRKVDSYVNRTIRGKGDYGWYDAQTGVITIPLHESLLGRIDPNVANPSRVLSTLAHETGHGMQNRFYNAAKRQPELQKERYAITNVKTPLTEIIADGYRVKILEDISKQMAENPVLASSLLKRRWLNGAYTRARDSAKRRNNNHIWDISREMGGPAQNIYDEAEVLGHIQYLANRGGLPGSGHHVIPQEQMDDLWERLITYHKWRHGY
jgi:hypothetical protein